MSVLKTYGESADDDFHPSKTWGIVGNRMRGYVDGLDAIMQAADLMLSTERWECPIYSDDIGMETRDLIGKPREFVQGDLERRISECLVEDDRITGISDFSLTFSGDVGTATFTVNTNLGDFQQEVTIENGG